MLWSLPILWLVCAWSPAHAQTCHTECVYVPQPEGCEVPSFYADAPWPLDDPLRVAAVCSGDCWHASQGQQPGQPPFWVPADSFGPGGLQITWVGAEGAGRADPQVGEVVEASATLEATCDLVAVFAVDVALQPDTTYDFLGPDEHSHEVTAYGRLRTGGPLPEPTGDTGADAVEQRRRGAGGAGRCGCRSAPSGGPWLVWAVCWMRRRREIG